MTHIGINENVLYQASCYKQYIMVARQRMLQTKLPIPIH